MELMPEQFITLEEQKAQLLARKEELLASKKGSPSRCDVNDTGDNDRYAIDEIYAIERRLEKINKNLASATIIVTQNTDDRVVIGTPFGVKLTTPTGEELEENFTLIETHVAGGNYDNVSVRSPLGAAVEGKKLGEAFSYRTLEGEFTGEITAIYQTDCDISRSDNCEGKVYTKNKQGTTK